MDDDQQFCLRWNNHQSTLISVFDTLLENETLVDCTLAAEGKFLKAHKVVLSACSPYFATLLQEQYDKHPIFILKDVKYQELRAMMDYMYRGEVNISQDQLAALLKAAESLQIKGLSDNRTGGGNAPKQEHHRGGLNVPAGKLSGGYTLEQTKRARVGPSSMDSQDMCGSREGSSSPSRRRRKVRRRSIENAMGDVHDNSNSSQIQANQSSLLLQQQQQQQQQSNASLAGVGAITAAASALASHSIPVSSTATPLTGSTASAASIAAGAAASSTTQQQQQLTTSVNTKKTESVKGTTSHDAMNTETSTAGVEEQEMLEHVAAKIEKQNHKQKSAAGKDTSTASELVIEPKSEYDDEGNDETVEDLTLDDEDMGMDDLDHNAGTSQGGEGSSQGYAPWQHDRSQDELLLATQEAQQRDPQVKHDKSEQTDITPEEFELDDCLLESNDIVITQNKDGFVLHVKKLGNITTAKLATADEEQAAAAAVAVATGGGHQQHQQTHIATLQDVSEVKPVLTTLTTSQAIKLPSSECELINLKKIIPATTTIAAHHPHATIIQSQQLHHHQHQQQQQLQHHQQQQQEPQQHHIQQHQAQVQSIVTTHAGHGQTINLMGLRNVQITEQKPIVSRIKYSRGKIITPQGTTTANVQIVEAHEDDQELVEHHQHHQHHHQQQHIHELTEGTKYEISEIDLNNPTASAAIISDLVKYAEIDDIELADGTKIGIGFAPTDITEHIQTHTTSTTAQIGGIEDDPMQQQQQHHHQQLQTHHIQQHPHHHQLQLQEHDDATTSVEATIMSEGITVHDPSITKSYTILTTRPMKQEANIGADGGTTTTTTYELSLSDSSMGQPDDTESKYVCRHCGKKYRWKSTLRRHENVECGGKEPCHPCPHCSYKAKQRGNLGVHVRKHHPDKPQLESKRGRKC